MPPTRIPPPTVTAMPAPPPTRAATRVPTVTPARRPAGPGGAYYEDEQGNPLGDTDAVGRAAPLSPRAFSGHNRRPGPPEGINEGQVAPRPFQAHRIAGLRFARRQKAVSRTTRSRRRVDRGAHGVDGEGRAGPSRQGRRSVRGIPVVPTGARVRSPDGGGGDGARPSVRRTRVQRRRDPLRQPDRKLLEGPAAQLSGRGRRRGVRRVHGRDRKRHDGGLRPDPDGRHRQVHQSARRSRVRPRGAGLAPPDPAAGTDDRERRGRRRSGRKLLAGALPRRAVRGLGHEPRHRRRGRGPVAIPRLPRAESPGPRHAGDDLPRKYRRRPRRPLPVAVPLDGHPHGRAEGGPAHLDDAARAATSSRPTTTGSPFRTGSRSAPIRPTRPRGTSATCATSASGCTWMLSTRRITRPA